MKRALLAAAPLLAAVAPADIVFIQGPGNIFGDENVLYNRDFLADNDTLIEGITNRSEWIVNFLDAGEDLVTPSGGQARVESEDGAMTALKIELKDDRLLWSSLIANLHAAADGSVTFTVGKKSGGTASVTFDLDENGQNFFRILATDGDTIDWVRFTTNVDLDDVRQIRVGVVPEPASMAVLAVGVAALARMRKRA